MKSFTIHHDIGDTVYVKTNSIPVTVEERTVTGWVIDHMEGAKDDQPRIFYRVNGGQEYEDSKVCREPGPLFGFDLSRFNVAA